ncbi:MAG: hypothetical protein V4697_01015 [Patescibacteria group bacterium]
MKIYIRDLIASGTRLSPRHPTYDEMNRDHKGPNEGPSSDARLLGEEHEDYWVGLDQLAEQHPIPGGGIRRS